MTDEQERIREAGRQNIRAMEQGMREAESPLRGVTTWGANIAKTLAAGVVEHQTIVMLSGKRLAAIIETSMRLLEAERAERHADWYCSLSWYRRWWAMVRGR